MPLFVTVTPGTTVTSSTTLDASTLNLLGTPSVDVTGTVDGGSITLGVQSVPLPSLYAQADQTIVGNGSAASASPVALTTTDLVLTATTVNIKAAAVTTAKIADSNVTFAKIENVASARLLGNSAGTAGVVQELTVGSNLTLSAGALNALRPALSETTVTSNANSYSSPIVRINAVELAALTRSITTQTATSKVNVTFNVSYDLSSAPSDDSATAGYSNAFILTRTIGASEVELGVPSGFLANQVYGIKTTPYQAFQRYTIENMVITFVDSPPTASTCTYKLKFYGSRVSTIFINRTSDNENQSKRVCATSQVILQEILP
jgi:hypothetical protein